MGKLAFGSVILGVLLRADVNTAAWFLFGVAATVLLFIGGALVLRTIEK